MLKSRLKRSIISPLWNGKRKTYRGPKLQYITHLHLTPFLRPCVTKKTKQPIEGDLVTLLS